jgi:hypothetical protein
MKALPSCKRHAMSPVLATMTLAQKPRLVNGKQRAPSIDDIDLQYAECFALVNMRSAKYVPTYQSRAASPAILVRHLIEAAPYDQHHDEGSSNLRRGLRALSRRPGALTRSHILAADRLSTTISTMIVGPRLDARSEYGHGSAFGTHAKAKDEADGEEGLPRVRDCAKRASVVGKAARARTHTPSQSAWRRDRAR